MPLAQASRYPGEFVAPSVSSISCGSTPEQVLYRLNGGDTQEWAGSGFLSVGANETLAVAICNYGNIEVVGLESFLFAAACQRSLLHPLLSIIFQVDSMIFEAGVHLVPEIIKNVGDGARVQVNVKNCANVRVSTQVGVLSLFIFYVVRSCDIPAICNYSW